MLSRSSLWIMSCLEVKVWTQSNWVLYCLQSTTHPRVSWWREPPTSSSTPRTKAGVMRSGWFLVILCATDVRLICAEVNTTLSVTIVQSVWWSKITLLVHHPTFVHIPPADHHSDRTLDLESMVGVSVEFGLLVLIWIHIPLPWMIYPHHKQWNRHMLTLLMFVLTFSCLTPLSVVSEQWCRQSLLSP